MTPTPIYQDHTGRWREQNPQLGSKDCSYRPAPCCSDCECDYWDKFEQSITYHDFPNAPNVKPGEVVMAYLQWQYKDPLNQWANILPAHLEDNYPTDFVTSDFEVRQIWVAANQEVTDMSDVSKTPVGDYYKELSNRINQEGEEEQAKAEKEIVFTFEKFEFGEKSAPKVELPNHLSRLEVYEQVIKEKGKLSKDAVMFMLDRWGNLEYMNGLKAQQSENFKVENSAKQQIKNPKVEEVPNTIEKFIELNDYQPFQEHPNLSEVIQHAACFWKTDMHYWSLLIEEINKLCLKHIHATLKTYSLQQENDKLLEAIYGAMELILKFPEAALTILDNALNKKP